MLELSLVLVIYFHSYEHYFVLREAVQKNEYFIHFQLRQLILAIERDNFTLFYVISQFYLLHIFQLG